jgi:hypothetical protein
MMKKLLIPALALLLGGSLCAQTPAVFTYKLGSVSISTMVEQEVANNPNRVLLNPNPALVRQYYPYTR